jgi:hypothetical protein
MTKIPFIIYFLFLKKKNEKPRGVAMRVIQLKGIQLVVIILL